MDNYCKVDYCKVILCKKPVFENGYCEKHFDANEKIRLENLKEDAMEKAREEAESKGDTFDESEWEDSYDPEGDRLFPKESAADNPAQTKL